MQIVRIGDGSTHQPSADVVGAKAANLARMAALGLPVPPAFVLPVSLCAAIARHDPHANRRLANGLAEGVAFLENATGRRFGDSHHPLLVSVRSGAARSMPGMLDTVLNVGCTPAAVRGLVRTTGNPRFAWDCRRRFLESYGGVVLGVDDAVLSRQLQKLVMEEGEDSQQALDCEALERLGDRYQHLIEEVDCVVPEDAMEQLEGAAQAVFRSWMSNRAQTYRQLQHLEHLKGTAVTIQAMVYGNRGTSSGAGVAFSRDPSTGAEQPVIDVLFESQGEDVVSGSRTPETEEAIARSMPRIAAQLRETLARLEHEFADVQDVEFTIEDGKLWMLQTRSAKRTPLAAIRFAADFVRQGMITPREALKRLDGLDVNALSRSHLVNAGNPIAHGVGASPGIAIGRAAFSPESAQGLADGGDPVILIRSNISTADVAAFSVSAGILTAVGGRTAHAALVARQLGKTCVVGCTPLSIDGSGRHASLADAAIKEGDWLTLDGDAGHVYLGRCEVAVERPDAELAAIESWRKAA